HNDRIKSLAARLSEYPGLNSVRNEIVEVISVNCRDLKSVVDLGRHETVAAIFKTRGGTSSAISRLTAFASNGKSDLSGKLPKTSITYSSGDVDDAGPEVAAARFYTDHDVSDYGKIIIDALHFRGITERRSTIPPAHEATFEWAWEDSSRPELDGAKWDPLAPWLREHDPPKGHCYWHHLRDWAGQAQLVVSSFYFWYAGTELQKSHAGLLRGLLFNILSSRPELAPILFPDICRAIISGSLLGRLQPSHSELRAAFANLVHSVPDDLRICFIVDGIDEYIGDPNDICELLLEATRNTSIKALVSSRPIPACCDRFRLCPSLRLHDLTSHDISQYVMEMLGSHHLMAKMEAMEPGVTVNVVTQVTSRACGVFLWVVLVVRNLVVRLQNYDTTAALLEEIEKLPPDLEKLYDHMLGSTAETGRILASKFLQLSFAVGDDYESCLQSSFAALSDEACEWRCEIAEGRLRSSCCGLCEVQDSLERPVRFIHRTVVEFLQINTVWEDITRLTSVTSFNSELALISSSVAELKATPVRSWTCKPSHNALTRLLRMLSYESHLSEETRKAFHERYLLEMKALASHWHNPGLFISPGQEEATVLSSYDRALRRLAPEYPHSLILSLGIQAADPYLYEAIENLPALNKAPQLQAFTGAYLMIHMIEEQQAQIRLLMSGAIENCRLSPTAPISCLSGQAKRLWNDRWKDALHKYTGRPWSLWEFLLHYCFSIINGTEDDGFSFQISAMSKSLLVTILALLDRGVPATATITMSFKSSGWTKRDREVSAWSVIMPVLRKIWLSSGSYSARDIDEISELSCKIETSLKRGGGAELDHCFAAPKAPIATKTASRSQDPPPKRRKKPGLIFLTSFGKGLPAREQAMKTTPASPPPASSGSASQSGSSEEADQDFTPTAPWFLHKARVQRDNNHLLAAVSGGSAGTSSSANGPKQPQPPDSVDALWQKKWHITHRSRRVELLSPEEQQLVTDLAQLNLTARENRRCLGALTALKFDKQRKILDCVEAMKAVNLGSTCKGST
ncbi:hypothetical protein B0H63DRAFT_529171, partial [Podospora didyma]